jgi:hypothetical protein
MMRAEMKVVNLIKHVALMAVLGISVIYGTDILPPPQDENTPPQIPQQGIKNPPRGGVAIPIYPKEGMPQGDRKSVGNPLQPRNQNVRPLPQVPQPGPTDGSAQKAPNLRGQAQPQKAASVPNQGLASRSAMKPLPQSQFPARASQPRMVAQQQPPMQPNTARVVPPSRPTQPLPPVGPHLYAAHECGQNEVVISSTPFPAKQPQVNPDSDKKCLALGNVQGKYSYDALLGALYAKRTEINTHTQALLSELKDNPDSVMTMVANSYSSDGKSFDNVNFLDVLNQAHIDSSRIRFLFDLSTKIYYKKDFALKANNRSIAYEQELGEKESRIADINATIKRLDEFTQKIDGELAKNNIARLNISDSDEEESDQKVPANVEISPKQGKGGRQHVAIQHLGGKYKIEVQNVLPAIIKSLAENYKEITGDVLPQNISLAGLESTLSKKKGMLKKELIEAKRAFEIFKDPNLRDFYAKLELIMKEEAKNFVPIDVFYRSAKYTTRYEFLGEIADKKANPKNDQKLKEISGVVLLRMDKNPNDKPPVDEFLIVFSGSNSATDWKHNLNWFKSQGSADHDIALGMRVHGGILDSLHETLDEFGTKFKYMLDKYKSMRPGVKPKLIFTVSGHSLGGALALLMGVFIKQNVKEYYGSDVDVDVRVITFGAPPMFNQLSAKKVDELLEKKILRFWNIGDPVANLSIIMKDTRENRSFLMGLLGFWHVGTSIPLFDTRKMAAKSEVFDPWKAHLADRYANLWYVDWVENGSQQIKALERLLQRRGFGEELKIYGPLGLLMMFLQDSTEASVLILGLNPKMVADIVKEHEQAANPVESKIGNLTELQKQRHKQGIADPLKFKKVDLSKEQKTIEYIQKIGGSFFQTKIKLDRSTSCEFKNLSKLFNFDGNLARYKGMKLDQNMQDEVCCTCCVVKNTFVSYGVGNIALKVKDKLSKANIKTPANILQHCIEKKHCTNEEVMKKLFPSHQDTIYNFGLLFKNIGKEAEWANKEVK